MPNNDLNFKREYSSAEFAPTKYDVEVLLKKAAEDGAVAVVPPMYVVFAKSSAFKNTVVSTFVGAENGENTVTAKCFEAEESAMNGADEIETALNIGKLRELRESEVLKEINEVKRASCGKILKLRFNCDILFDDEKLRVADIVSRSEADFISIGANAEDVMLFSAHLAARVKIKVYGANEGSLAKLAGLGAVRFEFPKL